MVIPASINQHFSPIGNSLGNTTTEQFQTNSFNPNPNDPFGMGGGVQFSNFQTASPDGGFQPASWGNSGFQPAVGGSPMGGLEDDFLDDEEKERVMRVEQENDERKRKLYEKMQEEEDNKRARKIKGKEDLDKWAAQRKREVEQRRSTNKEAEKMYHEQVQIQRNGPNPWERVVANCEMNSASYVGGADVSRMRQAMIARKADLTKSNGGAKKTV